MGTEVLHPQDCLIHRLRVPPMVVPHRRRNYVANGNSNARPGYKKWQPRKRLLEKRVSAPRRSKSTGELRPKRKHNCKAGDDSYAGSAFVQSPSPTSLPLPSFFNKKQGSSTEDAGFDDSATQHLRRLLRLG